MKVDIYTQNGKKAEAQIEVPESVFGAEVNDKLLAQYIYVYLSNQRASIAHTKDRGAVSGGGKKPWKQKGTGRARAGSNRSPIWKGGGITFGPTSDRNWKLEIPRQMRVGAIRSAFSKLLKADSLKFVTEIKLGEKELTKQAVKMVEAFGSPKKLTIVVPEKDEQVLKSFSNVEGVKVTRVGELNAYDILNAGQLIILKGSLDYISKKWL